jgi:hypothetical protein
MLNVVTLNVVTLNVVMLNVVMPSVVAPLSYTSLKEDPRPVESLTVLNISFLLKQENTSFYPV